jgi:hypothetical protein
MSWSVSGIGKPVAVAAKLAKDFAGNKCNEPEESIRQMAASAIAAALKVYPDTHAVKVEASGSQQGGSAGPQPTYVNQLNVKIEPVYGFVE